MQGSVRDPSFVAIAKIRVTILLHVPYFKVRRRESSMQCKPLVALLLVKVFLIQSLITFVLWFSFSSSFLYGFHLTILYQKNLWFFFFKNILGLMSSLRIANPDGRSATLNLLLFDVENYFICFFFPSQYFYWGSRIDLCDRIGLILVKPISYFLSGLFIFDIFNLLSRFLFFPFMILIPTWWHHFIP